MMGTKMDEKFASKDKRRHPLRDLFLTAGVVGVAVIAAVTLLNRNPPGQEPGFSPVAGIAIIIGGLIGYVALTVFYMKRTDEHDMNANLWGLSYGYLFFAGAAPAWWMLNHSGLAEPVDFWALYIISALVSASVWSWLRFR